MPPPPSPCCRRSWSSPFERGPRPRIYLVVSFLAAAVRFFAAGRLLAAAPEVIIYAGAVRVLCPRGHDVQLQAGACGGAGGQTSGLGPDRPPCRSSFGEFHSSSSPERNTQLTWRRPAKGRRPVLVQHLRFSASSWRPCSCWPPPSGPITWGAGGRSRITGFRGDARNGRRPTPGGGRADWSPGSSSHSAWPGSWRAAISSSILMSLGDHEPTRPDWLRRSRGAVGPARRAGRGLIPEPRSVAEAPRGPGLVLSGPPPFQIARFRRRRDDEGLTWLPLLWLIPVLPLLGFFLVLGLFGGRMSRSSWPSSGSVSSGSRPR